MSKKEEPTNLSQAKKVLKEKEQEFQHIQERYETVILFKDGSKMFLKSALVDREGEFYFIFSDVHPALLYHRSVVDSLVCLDEIDENDMEWAREEIKKRTDKNNEINMEESGNCEKIEKLRDEIEQIDREIFSKLEERLKLSIKIGDLKTDQGLEVHDSKREKEVIENIIKTEYELPDKFIEEVMNFIVTSMRKISKDRNE